MKILAFETSCDETSVSVIENGKKVLSNIISSQIEIHKEYGGVVPEIASRHHIENILPVFQKALDKANCTLKDIDYIAVTNTPGLIGSLLVGLMFAKSISYANNIPLITINHIHGHIFSNFIDNDIKLPAISLIISGGHTNLYYLDEKDNSISIELLGETLDDAVGETYDKVARILGLSYPGGPNIDKLAKLGNNILKIKTPKVNDYNFSFSGIKTFITNYVNQEKMKNNKIVVEDVASSLQNTVVNILYDKISNLLLKKNVKSILIGGGVSANSGIRQKFENFKNMGYEIHFPKLEYCTDNAAMIGCAAYYYLKKDKNLMNINTDAISTKDKKNI